MNLEKIKLYEQKSLTSKMLKESMNICYNNLCFSTFPYIEAKIKTSKEAIIKNSSGNCIAMSEFIKLYLKNNYNINSHIIISKCPIQFKTQGQSIICHCALLIPKTKKSFYIIDCAFFINDPLYIEIYDKKIYEGKMTDIYRNIENQMFYSYKKTDDFGVLKNSFSCNCECGDLKWSYYLNEIHNPDVTIGNEFHLVRNTPFLIKTKIINGKIIKVVKIKKEGDNITIIRNNIINIYNINKIPYNELVEIKKLYKYLRNTI